MQIIYLYAMNVRTRRHIGCGLLSLFVAYTVFLIAFYHVDIISGRMVAHAHYQQINLGDDYVPTPAKHSAEQLVFLHQLSSISTFGTAIIVAIVISRFDRIITTLKQEDNKILTSVFQPNISLRAPPTLF